MISLQRRLPAGTFPDKSGQYGISRAEHSASYITASRFARTLAITGGGIWSIITRSWGREPNFLNLLISVHIVASLVAPWPSRKSLQCVPSDTPILLIQQVIAGVLPTRAGDFRLPQSLIESAQHLLGDRDVICISVDFKAHRGFARSPLAGPKPWPGIPRYSFIWLIPYVIFVIHPPTTGSDLRLPESLWYASLQTARAHHTPFFQST